MSLEPDHGGADRPDPAGRLRRVIVDGLSWGSRWALVEQYLERMVVAEK